MKENHIKPWQENIIIYMLLIMAGNPMIMLYKSSIFTLYKIVFLAIVVLIFCKCKHKRMLIKDKKLKMFALFTGLMTVSVIANIDVEGVPTLISYYVFITLGMFISELISPKNFQKRFIQVMFVVSIISLLLYGLQLMNPELLNKSLWVTVYVNELVDYHSNFFYNAIVDKRFTAIDGSVVSLIDRNCGLFWEPGVYQFFISIGIVCLIENRKEEKHFNMKLFVFLWTLLSTVSVTGVVTLGIVVICYTLKDVKLFAPYITLAFCGGLFIGLPIFDSLLGRVVHSFTLHNLMYRTGMTALTFERIRRSLLWGQSFDVGSLNGYITLFLRFGTVFVAMWIWMLYKGSKAVAGRLLFVVIVIGLTSEPIAYNAIFWLIGFYAVAQEENRGRFIRREGGIHFALTEE